MYRERQKILKIKKMAENNPLFNAKTKIAAFIKENHDSDIKSIIEEYRPLLNADELT
jgi:hypothetical protein